MTDITLNSSNLTLVKGNSATLSATVSPSNATNRNVTWSSSNTSVATVSSGVVTAKAAGTATITCTAADGSGVKATCAVTVIPEFKLSAGLIEIEEEAFAGINAQQITLPDGVKQIGKRAFADCAQLRRIYIPDSVEYISADAFSGVDSLVICGVEGSYAQYYAGRYGYDFIDVD